LISTFERKREEGEKRRGGGRRVLLRRTCEDPYIRARTQRERARAGPTH